MDNHREAVRRLVEETMQIVSSIHERAAKAALWHAVRAGTDGDVDGSVRMHDAWRAIRSPAEEQESEVRS